MLVRAKRKEQENLYMCKIIETKTHFSRFVQSKCQDYLIGSISHRVYTLGKHTVRSSVQPHAYFENEYSAIASFVIIIYRS